ncbi:MAG TPA: class I SAM-dependent methyltransferase [Thermoanaerobaculia bacterium]|nr:class I SAM-dependent methyltransferase [Thermoanaerobaculia bacterium]
MSRAASPPPAVHPRFGPKQARRFYDRFGARQDRQAWYEDAALERLVALSDFGAARRLVELGCGTARLAARLFDRHLAAAASYRGFDLSPTMARLSSQRLRRYGGRVAICLVSGEPPLPVPDASADRFLSTYTLDLLSKRHIDRALEDAWRVLEPDGLLCLAGLAPGAGPLSRLVMGTWSLARRLRPSLVGGCRPIALGARLSADRWELRHQHRVISWGVASDVLIASRRETRSIEGPPAIS